MNLSGRYLTSAGVGISGATVEAYAVDASDQPTGTAVTSDTTDSNGRWDLTGLTAGTKYATKITNGAIVLWIDGADKVQVQDLDITGNFTKPAGSIVTADLADDAVTAAKVAAATITNAKLNSDVPRLNLLVNGGMEIWQRGTGPFSTTEAYTADRWRLGISGTSTLSVEKSISTGVMMGTGAMKLVGAKGTGDCFAYQVIEGHEQFRGRAVTLSVAITCATAAAVRIMLYDGTQSIASSNHTGSGTEVLTATMTVATASTMLVAYVEFVGTATAYADNCMLSFGSAAADFEPLTLAEEWERCQRYYEILGSAALYHGYGAGLVEGSEAAKVLLLWQEMKATTPTVTFSSAGHFGVFIPGNMMQCTVAAAAQLSTHNALVALTVASGLTTGHGALLAAYNTASSRIYVEANP